MNKLGTMVVSVLIMVAYASGMGAHGAVKTCWWTGNGDGSRLGDAANWNGAPVEGDVLMLTNATTQLLKLTNDLGSAEAPFRVQGLIVAGSGSIWLVGNPLNVVPKSGDASLVAAAPFTNDVDLVYSSTDWCRTIIKLGTSIGGTVTGYLVQNGKISAPGRMDSFRLNFEGNVTGSGRTAFYGDIDMPNTDLSTWGTSRSIVNHFYGRVTVKSANCSDGAQNPGNGQSMRGQWHLHHADNAIASMDVNSRKFYFYGNNGLGEDSLLRTGAKAEDDALIYFANGTDQIISNFGRNPSYATDIPTKNNAIQAMETSTASLPVNLTVKGKEDVACYFGLLERLALTWDPVTPAVLDMPRPFVHKLDEPLCVKRGTFRVSAAATFKNVPKIIVGENAVFEMSGASASALTGLRTVELAAGATFRLGASEVTPFTANQTVFHLRGSAKIEVDCSVTTPVSIFVDGVPVPADTYSTADWMSGSGSIVVVTPDDYYWTGTVDTDWNADGNWLHGIPQYATGKTAHIAKMGTTTVNVAEDAPTVKHLDLANEDGRTTLNVSATLAVSNGTLTVGKGAEIKVGEGGAFKYDVAGYKNDAVSPTLTMSDGAKITVDGGSLEFAHVNGKVLIGGGDATKTSSVEIVSGAFGITAAREQSFVLGKGGRVAMSGGTMRYTYDYGGASTDKPYAFYMTGGEVDLSGDAKFYMNANASHHYGAGRICISGTALLKEEKSSLRPTLGPYGAGAILDIEVSGHGEVDLKAHDREYFNGSVAGTKVRVALRDQAKASLGNDVYFGSQPGTEGELVLSGSSTCSDKYYGMTFGSGGSAADAAVGILRMSGGALSVTAAQAGTYPTLRGLVFGNGASASATGEIRNRGLAYISGGTVTVERGLHVGDGNGYGMIEQSGGSILMSQNKGWEINVGNHCGTGVYRMTGGTFSAPNSTVNVGANNGVGTVEFGSGTGTFTVNGLKFAGEKTMLKFVLASDGSVIRPNVTGVLTFGAGTKIVVDSTAYKGRKVNLMQFGSVTGSLSDLQIETPGAPKGRLELKTNWLQFTPEPKGIVVIVR